MRAPKRLTAALRRLSLAQQFLLTACVILVTGGFVIGWWTGAQIEAGVVSRAGATTALYVDSVVSPRLQGLSAGGALTPALRHELDGLLEQTTLGERIVAFKVWSLDGQVLYSRDAELIGRHFDVGANLERARRGEVAAGISQLREPENEFERRFWSELLEIYAPMRSAGSGETFAVLEFYQPLDELRTEIDAAKARTWVVVVAATVVMYGLLAGIVGRGNAVIDRQRRALLDRMDAERIMLAQNRRLAAKVQEASARTVALNEQFLRRVSADLHDGPAQDLGLALLRMGQLAGPARPAAETAGDGSDPRQPTVEQAVRRALAHIRSISAGLRIPELNGLLPDAVVARAVRDFRARTQAAVRLEVTGVPVPTSAPVSIALYRVVQESLMNGFHHAGGAGLAVTLDMSPTEIALRVVDAGPGFEVAAAAAQGPGQGLAGMRDRVAMLGGDFGVETAPGRGATVWARIPLGPEGHEDA